MSRGTSGAQEILYGEHVRARAIEPVIKLTDLQEVSLKAVASLMLKYPDAPGFESYDICEAGIAFSPDPSTALGYNNAGTIVSGLAQKGLAERAPSVLLLSRGYPRGELDEIGWRLTPRGLEHARNLGVEPFQPWPD